MQPCRHHQTRFLALVFFALVAFAPARSYDYFVQSIQSIIRNAKAIVEMEVTKIRQSIDEHNAVATIVTAKVNDVLVGKVEDATIVLTIQYLDYEGVNRPLNPRFAVGEKVIVPLVKLGNDWSVLGHDQGRFKITGNTIEGSNITSADFKQQIKDVAAGRSERIEVPLRKRQSDGGIEDGYPGEGTPKLGGEFHLLNPVRWGPTSGTINLRINPANAVDKDGNALSFSAIQECITRAVTSWNTVVHSRVTFYVVMEQTSQTRINGDGVSTVTFETHGTNAEAYTGHSNGIINEVDLKFNSLNRWNTNSTYPSTYPPYLLQGRGWIGPVDLEDVAAHELGHGVGLHHVSDSYPTYTLLGTLYTDFEWWENTSRRSLELGDKAGKIYQDPNFPSSTTQQNSKILLSALASMSFSGNFTVPTGSSLQFEPGRTINFPGNYKLRVEGKLITSGNTVFTRSGGQWYGIEFYNGNAGSSLWGSTIQNAQYGVYVYNTYAEIAHNTIQNNSKGIYEAASQNGVNTNLIRANTYGVYCANYGDVALATNNILRENNYGVWGDGTSEPYLGQGVYYGYNSLYSNSYYDVYSSYGGTIHAEGNWWGSYPADPPVTGNVDFSPALDYNPNNWAKIAVNAQEQGPRVRQNAGLSDTVGLGELDAAHQLMREGKSDLALPQLLALASRLPENFAGMKALVLATRIREEQGTDARSTLESAQAQHPGTRLELQARQLLVGTHLKQGNVDGALALAEGLTEASDPLIQKLALYDAGNILWYRKGDTQRAEVYFRRLASLWPQDPLTSSALATMGESYEMPDEQPDTQPDVAASYAMAESYPNPFNPTTAIRYTLAEDAMVSLVVTDILGRVVARLVDENQVRGSYTTTWNARHSASGIYFAKLTVTNELGQVKFTKVNKLLLMK